MNQPHFKITISKSCHENWESMTPNEKGKHCLVCQKTVVDFTSMTDAQIIDYFQNYKGSTCGRFYESQVERPIAPLSNIKTKTHWAWLFSAFLLPLSVKAQTNAPFNIELAEKYVKNYEQQITHKEKSSKKHNQNPKEEEKTVELSNILMGDTNLEEPPLSFKSSEEILADMFQSLKNWLIQFLLFLKTL